MRATTHKSRITNHARALTLTEILVVIGIIVLVLGLAVPALSVWEGRKVQDAINLTGNLLKRAQSTAMTEHRVVGLFFYVEPEAQTQFVWPIEPDMDPGAATETADRFVLRDTEPFMIPKPMRIVPASVLDTTLPVHLYWTAEQLASEVLRDPADALADTPNDGPGSNELGTQYHRNFFVILFDRTGIVNSRRRVFIRDPDTDDYPFSATPTEVCGGAGGDSYPGFRTRLIVIEDDNGVVDFDCAAIHFQSADRTTTTIIAAFCRSRPTRSTFMRPPAGSSKVEPRGRDSV
jgi:type II secretory pathway pseudopilin PulG